MDILTIPEKLDRIEKSIYTLTLEIKTVKHMLELALDGSRYERFKNRR